MKKLILLLLIGGLLNFSSCGKEGPVGPRGYDGNANVIGESSFTIRAGDWGTTTNVAGNFGHAYYASLGDDNITNAVANHGMVVMYIQYADGTWKSLPDIFAGTSFSFNFAAGGFDIYYTDIDGSIPSNPGDQTFRAVIIPSSIVQAHPSTNWKNYKDVIALMNSAHSAGSNQ